MPTTIRAEDDVKAALDRFQGHLLAETGERLSHSQLLARLLRFAERHEAEFLRVPKDDRRTLTPEELDRILADLTDIDVDVDVTQIDRVLYGGEDV